MQKSRNVPVIQALLAAVLFGSSAPLAKLLLAEVDPTILAGLLYLGSGLSAVVLRLLRHAFQPPRSQEAGLDRGDLPWLAGAVLAGGVLGPILLMVSLKNSSAATASLLLNFESVATVLIAALLFSEAIGRQVWWAVGLVVVASVLLTYEPGQAWGFSVGALGVLGACFLWGLDNNFTRQISARDPLVIVTIKGLAAGSFSLLLGLALGSRLPQPAAIFWSLVVGSLSYGLSIALFVLALRGLGAARTGALFATAPFVGAALSLALFREPVSWPFLLSVPLMVAGMVLLLREEHSHQHLHYSLEHAHRHDHDDAHHTAHHVASSPPDSHSHLHSHESAPHNHPHAPDIHHRHGHEEDTPPS